MHLIQDLPFITALSTAAISHRKTISAGTCCDSHKAHCVGVVVGTGTPTIILWSILVKCFGPY
jgi:hypothetical protein